MTLQTPSRHRASVHGRRFRRAAPALRPVALAAACLLAGSAGAAPPALPTGLQVMQGQATVATSGARMTVTNSANAILNWQQFSIGAGNTVRFDQPSTASRVLNRVVGNDPSSILGQLSSNGQVWLLNPRGVLFGAGARVDVASLVASTLQIGDADWLARRFRFSADSSTASASVVNQGTLRTTLGGQVLLLGSGEVRNEGLIEAPGGQVMLAAGASVDLVDTAVPRLELRVSAPQGEVLNLGSIVAASGRIDLQAAIVNQQGIVRADALASGSGGQVQLQATQGVTLGAGSVTSASAGAGGQVGIDAGGGTLLAGGAVAATGSAGPGGSATLLGRQIGLLDGSVVDVSGSTGGGQALVGGGVQGRDATLRNADAVYMAPAATVRADATTRGDGGRIVLWSDNATRAYGNLSARGGPSGGDGGFIETSGGWLDARPAAVRTDAPAGRAGRWLLDPDTITISDAGDSHIDTSAGSGTVDFSSGADSAVLGSATINAALNAGNNVTVTTQDHDGSSKGDIKVINATLRSAPPGAVSLTLDAYRDITVDNSTIASTGAPLSLVFNAGNGGSDGGVVRITGSTINTAGGDIRLGGTNLGCYGDMCSSFTGAVATDSTSTRDGVRIASSTIDAGSGGIAINGISVAQGGDTSAVSITDGATLAARTIDINGIVFSDGDFARTGVKLAGGTMSATERVMVEGAVVSVNTYWTTSPPVGVDVLGEVRIGTADYSTSGALTITGTVVDTGESSGGSFVLPRYGVAIRGGAKLTALGGATMLIQGEMLAGAGDLAIYANGSTSGFIDASQGSSLTLSSSSGDIKIAGGQIWAPSYGSLLISTPGTLAIDGAQIGIDPNNSSYLSVTLEGSQVSIGSSGNATGLNFGGGYVMVDITADNFSIGASSPGPGQANLVAGGPITILADRVAIGYNAAITSYASDDAIIITGNSSFDNSDSLKRGTSSFSNRSDSSALQAPYGRWLVYAVDSDNPDFTFDPGGLVADFRQYDDHYSNNSNQQLRRSQSNSSSAAGQGNGFIFDAAPVLTLVGGDSVAKVYDGTTAADLEGAGKTLFGLKSGESLSGPISYADKNVGSEKALIPGGPGTGIVDSNGAPVYGYQFDSSFHGDISALHLTTVSSVAVDNKNYDGNRSATVSSVNMVGKIAGDDLGVTASGSFDTRNAGTGKPVAVSLLGLNGADAGNYVLDIGSASGTADILPLPLTIVRPTVSDKVYDGGTVATLNAIALSGVLAGDSVTATAAGAAFLDKAAGIDKPVALAGLSLGGSDAGNYTVAPATIATISPKSLTVSGGTAADKVYDRTAAATVTSVALSGLVPGDAVSASAASAAFADPNVGSGKPVTFSGLSLAGGDAANYTLAGTSGSTSASITPKGLTVTGGSAADKVYDGNTVAAITGVNLAGVIEGDSVTASASGSFADKNAGVGKAVTFTGFSLGGSDAGNYGVTSVAAGTSASITPRPLAVAGGSAADKVYDGNVAATITAIGLTGIVTGDAVSASAASAAFVDKNAGNGKTVNFSGLALAGADAANYSVGGSGGSTSASITPKPLTVAGGSAADKVYDGNTVAAITGVNLAGVITGDSVSASAASGSFADKNAGVGKAVTFSGFSLGGSDAANYTVASASGSTSASITPKLLTVAGSAAADKVYDGNAAATITSVGLTGIVAGDAVNASAASAAFVDKNVGSGKPVSYSGLSLAGGDAANYTLASTAGNTAASITPRPLTVAGGSAADKVYDGNTVATITGVNLAGVVAGDSVSASAASGSFADKNAGIGKAVSFSGFSLGGSDAGNYTLGSGSASTSASITPKPLAVAGGSAADKVYDGNTAATITSIGLAGIVAGDAVSANAASAAFVDKNAGSGKTVNFSGLALAGADAANYSVGGSGGSATASITPKPLTVAGGSAADKVYDGSTAAAVTGLTLAGVIAGDTVIGAAATATFGDKNVGIAKPVTVSGFALGGADAANYTVASSSGILAASITPKTLTAAGGTAADKVYDATTAATITGVNLAGVIAGDAVSASAANAAFADKNVGAAKAVSFSGFALTGSDAVNYMLASNSGGSTTASITPKALTVAGGTAADKVYDATAAATITSVTLSGVIAGDVVTASAANAAFADKNVGSGKTVAFGTFSVAGADSGNYLLGLTTGLTTKASITPATLAYVADPVAIAIGDTLPTLTGGVSGLRGSDTLASATTGSLQFAITTLPPGTPGRYAIDGSGLAAQNYVFVQAAGNATALTIAGPPALQVLDPTVAGSLTMALTLLPQPVPSSPAKGRALDAMLTMSPAGGGQVFDPLALDYLSAEQVTAALAARDQYKKTLLAQAITRLEQDPGLADAPSCASAEQAANGQCLMLAPLALAGPASGPRVVEQVPAPGPARAPAPAPAPAAAPPSPTATAPATAAAAAAAPGPATRPLPSLETEVMVQRLLELPPRRPVRQATLPQIQRKIAVLIGIDRYSDPRIPKLSNAASDARAMSALLETKLGYETLLLQNPTRTEIYRALNRLAFDLQPSDSVVLYYAGHGELVEKSGLGYWLPADADPDRPETWISNTDIGRLLHQLPSSQLAMISDSCFSGSLISGERIRGAPTSQDPSTLLSHRAAVVMSSGGNEPVSDSGKEGHSLFTWSLMQSLQQVPDWKPGSAVFEQVRFAVARQLPQRPQYGASQAGGHEAGADYLFERRQLEGLAP